MGRDRQYFKYMYLKYKILFCILIPLKKIKCILYLNTFNLSIFIFSKIFANQPLYNYVKMAPRMAAVLRAPGKLCSFSYVLFVFLLFYVLDVVSITVYDRDTLLNIGSSVAQRKPDFFFEKKSF